MSTACPPFALANLSDAAIAGEDPPEPDRLDRRRFLRQLPATGLLASGLTAAAQTPAADGSKRTRSKAEFEKCAARLEVLGQSYLGVAPAEGRLLHQLVRITRARQVLEIGTCFGLASIWMALALEETDGALVSIEILSERVRQAEQHVREFGLERRIKLQEGDAHQVVTQRKERFDFVLLNADRPGNLDYFKKLHPDRLTPQAVLLAARVVREPEKQQNFLDAIKAHADYDSAVLSAVPEDGFLLASRRRA